MPTNMPQAEADLRALARILAPYIATELGLAAEPSGGEQAEAANADYDETQCRAVAGHLSVGALRRAEPFFVALARDGRINSVQVAELLELSGSRAIAGALTNSLKQACRKVVPSLLPWDETEDGDGRTVWLDRDGTAAGMAAAVGAELERRLGAQVAS